MRFVQTSASYNNSPRLGTRRNCPNHFLTKVISVCVQTRHIPIRIRLSAHNTSKFRCFVYNTFGQRFVGTHLCHITGDVHVANGDQILHPKAYHSPGGGGIREA